MAKNQESLYLLAGMEEQARRLRYLVTKPRAAKATEPEETEDDGETPAPAPAAETPASVPTPEADRLD